MAKKNWTEGEVLYATGTAGVNQNLLQFVAFDTSSASSVTNSTTETTVGSVNVSAGVIQKRAIVLAQCYLNMGRYDTAYGAIAESTSASFVVKVNNVGRGTVSIGATTEFTSQVGGGDALLTDYNNTVLYAIDESTDFSSQSTVTVTATIASVPGNSGNVTAGCSSILILGA
jgi:hypothetical protein